jgi:hypothetical protein
MMKRLSATLLALGFLNACAGHESVLPASSSSRPTSSPTKSTMHIRVVVRKKIRHHYEKYVTRIDSDARGKKLHHRVLSPEYVSASTISLKFTLNTVNGSAPPAGFTTTKTFNLSSCANASGTYTCALAWVVPAGSDNFSVYDYDGASGTGNLLAVNSITQTVAGGSSNIAITLWGIPASVKVTGGTYVTGSNPTFTTRPAILAYSFSAAAYDADGNVILPYNQFIFSAGSTYTFGGLTGDSITATPPHSRVAVSGGMTATLNTAALGYPYSCPAANCADTVTIATSTPPESLVTTHGVSNSLNVWAGSDIDSALLGGTSIAPTGSLTTQCSTSTQGAYMDASGNLYARCNSGSIDVFSAAAVKSAATTTGVARTGQLICSSTVKSPTGVACGTIKAIFVDTGGNLFATDTTGGVWIWNAATVASALSGSTGLQPTAGISTMTSGPNLGTILRDATSGNLIVAVPGGGQTTVCSGGPYRAVYIKKSAVNTAILGNTFTATMQGCLGSMASSSNNNTYNGEYETLADDGGNVFFADSYIGLVGCPPSCYSVDVSVYSSTNISGWAGTGLPGQSSDADFSTSSGQKLGLVFDGSRNLIGCDFQSNYLGVWTSTQVTNAEGGTSPSNVKGSWTLAHQADGGCNIDTTTNTLFAAEYSSAEIEVLNSSGYASMLAGSTAPTTTGTLAAPGPKNPWLF